MISQFFTSSSLSKEQLAREIMERDQIKKGHYYRITNKGYEVMATAIKFRAADMVLLAA
jgi:hypothetical protein